MKVQVPLGKPQPGMLLITLVALALGALIAAMLSATSKDAIDPTSMRPEHLAMLYAQSKRENDELQDEVLKLRTQLDDLIDATTSDQELKEALRKEISDLRIRAGQSPVEGPGIVIVIDDSKLIKPNPGEMNANALITHDVDLLLLVNELRGAGAEAISINDQRLAASTAVRCVGPVIHVNNRAVAPPFVIKAIGKPNDLYGAVNLPYGVLDQLKPLGISVTVEKRETIRVPAIPVLPDLQSGKVATDAPDQKKPSGKTR